MNPLKPEIKKTLDKILLDLNFPRLYKEYEWKGDTYDKGFPDLCYLETTISDAAKNGDIRQHHLIEIAKWGKLRNAKGISCAEPLSLVLYENGEPAPGLLQEPENAIKKIDALVKGFGPTYSSKLLHFAVPKVFGALDTRLVRIFGNAAPEYRLLDLNAAQSGDRWLIPPGHDGWPGEYGTWIAVLNYLAEQLNKKGNSCPHPRIYYEKGLREEGVWLPADVETALFSYASQQLKASSGSLENIIGYTFRDRQILTTATTRRASLNDLQVNSNDCLEPLATLGDAALDVVAINRLYKTGGKSEGELSQEKSDQVKRSRTRAFFLEHNLQDYIRWGNVEYNQRIWETGEEAPDSVTEALIGAIFLDAEGRGRNGLKTIQEFLEKKNFFENNSE
jgi:hypothetical protein